MGVRKQSEKNVRKLTRLGGKSLAVTLPIDLIEKLGWREKQKVIVKKVLGGLLIKDWKKWSDALLAVSEPINQVIMLPHKKKKYVLIDTDRYIDICFLDLEKNSRETLIKLEKLLNKSKFILLLPEVVELEFQRRFEEKT